MTGASKLDHHPECPLGSATGPVAIACKHGFDVCPKCDPCRCEVLAKNPLRGPCPVLWFYSTEGTCPLCLQPKSLHFQVNP